MVLQWANGDQLSGVAERVRGLLPDGVPVVESNGRFFLDEERVSERVAAACRFMVWGDWLSGPDRVVSDELTTRPILVGDSGDIRRMGLLVAGEEVVAEQLDLFGE
ncbi:hypothetical protein [Chlorobium sp.]|uniref:hypothetical protein n=1 Tax=Chlorobium sp. TaxID=1095 RepID=UPI003C3AD3E0